MEYRDNPRPIIRSD